MSSQDFWATVVGVTFGTHLGINIFKILLLRYYHRKEK